MSNYPEESNNAYSQLAEMRRNLDWLIEFASTHPVSLPSHLVILSLYGPLVTIQASHAPHQQGVDKVLSAVGDAYGRDGWKKRPSRYNLGRFDYRKEIGGVKLCVEGAERFTFGEDIPVPPSAFPVLLEDAAPKES